MWLWTWEGIRKVMALRLPSSSPNRCQVNLGDPNEVRSWLLGTVDQLVTVVRSLSLFLPRVQLMLQHKMKRCFPTKNSRSLLLVFYIFLTPPSVSPPNSLVTQSRSVGAEKQQRPTSTFDAFLKRGLVLIFANTLRSAGKS